MRRYTTFGQARATAGNDLEQHMGSPRRLSILLGLALAAATPATAQFSDSFNFIKAIKDANGSDVMTYLNKPGAPVLNARDGSTGETALHIVTRRHDSTWLSFLLARGADTSIKDRSGLTPLAIAAQGGDVAAASLLLQAGANANAVNASGETPLILAVHNRDLPMVRLLLTNRANPDTADTIAGKSARDYATEDRRGAPLLKLFEEAKAKPATTVMGPTR